MNKKIRDVDAMAKKILEDEELMNAIDRMEMAIIDEKLKLQYAYETGEKSGIEKGIEQGEKNGIEIGKKENSKKIAKEMKKANKPIEEIIQFTGLTKEEIEEL